MKSVIGIDTCQSVLCKRSVMILPLMTETLTSKKRMDVNERLHVNFIVGWMPLR